MVLVQGAATATVTKFPLKWPVDKPLPPEFVGKAVPVSEAVVALSRLGGVASHRELCDEIGRRRIRTAVSAGLIVRTAAGTYAIPGVDAARRAAVELSGALGLASAALAHGWKVKRVPERPTIYVRPNRNINAAARRGIDLRWAALTPGESERRVTDPARTVIDCARFLPFDEALAIADSARRSGEVGERELIDAAERSPRTGRRSAIRVATHATHVADNPMESVLRAICLEIRGLDVCPQVRVGDIGRADLVDQRRGLVIEAESMEFHGTLEGYRRDVRRYTAFVRCGYLVLRFCWEDIMLRPDYVRETIVDVLDGWHSRPPQRDARGLAA